MSPSTIEWVADLLSQQTGEKIQSVIEGPFGVVLLGERHASKIRWHKPSSQAAKLIPSDQGLIHREFERGRRFNDDLYEGVVHVGPFDDRYVALIMKRLPLERSLNFLLRNRLFDAHCLSLLDSGLNSLRRRSIPVCVRDVCADHQETLRFLGTVIAESVFDDNSRLLARLRRFTEASRHLLRDRAEAGFVWDTHGDLHAGNVFLTTTAVFIDPAVVEERFYIVDYLSQLASVFVDLYAAEQLSAAEALYTSVRQSVSDEHAERLFFRVFCPLRALIRVAISILYARDGFDAQLPADVGRYVEIASLMLMR